MATSSSCTGGCACGSVRYESATGPMFAAFCHCRDCQSASGGPFAANVWLDGSSFKFTKGDPASRVVTSESGNTVRHYFCPDCGSPLGMQSEGYTEIWAARALSLDDPNAAPFAASIWTSRAPAWVQINPDVPAYDIQPTDEEIERLVASVMGA